MTAPARRAQPLDSDAVVREVSRLIHGITGVQLGDRQHAMVLSRLRRRIQELGLPNETAYWSWFKQHEASETHELVSLLTTHHTYFFRESVHFEFLAGPALRAAAEAAKARGDRTVRVWSAACSQGQEVYTLAMVLSHHLSLLDPTLRFEVVGSDVDPKSLAMAKNGVYYHKQVKEVPAVYLADHWARGRGDIAAFVKAKPSLKAHCRFEAVNLLAIPPSFQTQSFDFIFCRNVFIYFTPEQIKAISQVLIKGLRPGGHLVIGVSESLNGVPVGLVNRGPSIYQWPAPGSALAAKAPAVTPASASASPAPSAAAAPTPNVAPARPVRVFCVDDSPSIIAILKRVFTPEHGFEVVGTAANGREAAEKAARVAFDVMTLDIHMPEVDGLSYLMKHKRPGHPPVVMISSVQREDLTLAQACFTHGAVDYVEKPSLGDMADRADEIRLKVACADRLRQAAPVARAQAALFEARRPTFAPASAVRVVVCGLQDKERVAAFLREATPVAVPTLILVDAPANLLDAFRDDVGRLAAQAVAAYAGQDGFAVAAGSLKTALPTAKSALANRRAVILVFGEVTNAGVDALKAWPKSAILAEDIPRRSPGNRLRDAARDVVPATSFAYMALDWLERLHG